MSLATGTEARALTAEEREAFRVVRLVAFQQMPYYAAGLFSLIPVALPGLGTWAVDRWWRVYLDPELLVGENAWPVRESGGVLCHELNHVLRVHAERATALPQPYSHDAWNLAADAEINDDLLDAGVELPDGVVTPKAIGCDDHGMAEDYYAHVVDDDPGGGGGSGPAEDGEPGCGSGAGLAPVPGELAPAHAVDGQTGVDEATGGLIRRQIAEAVREAAGKGRGTVPAGLQRWANGVLSPPKVPWQRVLRSVTRQAVVEAAGRVQFTYTRPSRRQSPGLILPSMRGPKVRVAIVLDTSASMTTADLLAGMAEIRGVLKSTGISGDRVTLLTCDAANGTPQRISRVDSAVLTGGGGTDMRVGIAAADALRPPPHVTIVISDGDTPWPDHPPRSKLVCVIVGNEHAASRTPGFALTARVPSGAGS
ncbi:vWA domain-containing protein [Mycolicibacterium palauense]|uniref:vWA domain-containing protein n=1 Tax=Mycolicibacterium palauense TaxID=2034511 RepID=UPI000BFEB971|nr:VWA-like domain-containing protein [Mycolicibacterium palauense]